MTGPATGSPALALDLRSASPPYEQLRTQLAGHIHTGALGPGDRLPTVRALAADLGLAVNTVARAYRELESAGLVESRRRTGTVVAQRPDADAAAPDVRALQPAVDALIARARQLAVPDETVLDVVRATLGAG